MDENNSVNNVTDNSDIDKKEEKSNYSYQFNPNSSSELEKSEQEDSNTNSNENYLGGYQLNQGKGLVKSFSGKSSSMKYPYGIRGDWTRGAISILGIAILLGILVLIVTFLV